MIAGSHKTINTKRNIRVRVPSSWIDKKSFITFFIVNVETFPRIIKGVHYNNKTMAINLINDHLFIAPKETA